MHRECEDICFCMDKDGMWVWVKRTTRSYDGRGEAGEARRQAWRRGVVHNVTGYSSRLSWVQRRESSRVVLLPHRPEMKTGVAK